MHVSLESRFSEYLAPINVELRLAALRARWVSCRLVAAELGTRNSRPYAVPQRAWWCSSLIKLLPSGMWLDALMPSEITLVAT